MSDGDDQPPAPPGHLRPTSGASLAIAATIGLVLGWSTRPVMVRLTGAAPLVTWAQALVLPFVATILAYVAWHTWQTLQVHHRRLEGNRAVNRLVLARSCVLVGALMAGGYVGYAVSWLGHPSELADERVMRCAVAAAGATLVMVMSLLLERACRVPPGDEEP